MPIILTGTSLTIEEVVRVARQHERVAIHDAARANLDASRAFIERASHSGQIIYGVTTGFGNFKNVLINSNQVEELQRNLIMSHAVGTGIALPEDQVRAAILIRINSLLHGHSGIRAEVVQRLVDVLNEDIYPYVPSQGSVGSSGDLAPLSHIILVIMGMGEVLVDGKRTPALDILQAKRVTPVTLLSKEGLALTNGTAVQTGIGCLALVDCMRLAQLADAALAMSLEALMGSIHAYDQRIHAIRPHPGQMKTADNIRRLCAESPMIASHANCGRVQDAYSLRCSPQVHGACRDGIQFVKNVLEIELNSVTDNPLIFADEQEVISGGNFHGEPIALAMDHLKICAAELANISERRTAKLVDPATSEGLPAFLIPKDKGGLNNGYMIAQYTSAALVSENKVLAHPASVDSIPTSANQEDHVSMGTIAARQAYDIVQNSTTVITIELMCAAQGLDFRKPLEPGIGTREVYARVRSIIPPLTDDRILYLDVERLRAEVRLPTFLHGVESRIGTL